MALQSMRFDRRRWSPVRDALDVVHLGTRLSKPEVEYQFRLADAVRTLVPCGQCGAKEGDSCVRKRDGGSMSNHSYRVRQARWFFVHHVLPRIDRIHQTLCSTLEGPAHVVFGASLEQDIDCMSCLVIASRQGG